MSKGKNNQNQNKSVPDPRAADKNSKSRPRRGSRPRSDKRAEVDARGAEGAVQTSLPETRYSNPVQWYTHYPDLAIATATVPFPYKPGNRLPDLQFRGSSTVADFSQSWRLPGVCALEFVPTVGYSADSESPASVIAQQLWIKIRKAFSGSNLNADAPDIFMYTMALDSFHMYIAYLKRLYGLVTQYRWDNRLFPDAVLSAMGLDPSEVAVLQGRMKAFCGEINTLVRYSNAFFLPQNSMHIFDRHKFMCERVYKDEDINSAQAYVFVPHSVYKLAYTDSRTQLIGVEIPHNIVTGTEFFQFGLSLYQAISSWADALSINGYLLRAYETNEIVSSELLAEDYITEFVYDATVLSQIENARDIEQIPEMHVDQNPIADNNRNAILTNPVPLGLAHKSYNTWLNMHHDMVMPGDILEATRLMYAIVPDGSELGYHIDCGSELITYIYYIGLTNDMTQRYHVPSSYVARNLSQLQRGVRFASRIGAFAHHPPLFLTEADELGNYISLNWELCNLTELGNETLARVHQVCMQSLFNSFG